MVEPRRLAAYSGLAIAVAAGTYFVAGAPSYVIEAEIQLEPDDAGGYFGSITGLVSKAAESSAYARPRKRQDAAADSDGQMDAGSSDSGVYPDARTDSGQTDATPTSDAGTTGNGIFDPNADSGSPPGRIFSQPALTQPVAGASVIDPVFGTRLRRMLARGAHEYSQLQVMSDDGTHALLIEDGIGHVVLRMSDGARVLVLPAAALAPRWIPGTRSIFYVLGNPVRVMRLNVDDGVVTELIRTAWTYAVTAQIFEAPSDDGRWTALFVHNGGSRSMVGVDLVNARLTTWALDVHGFYASGVCAPDPQWGEGQPNWFKPTPLGRYLAVQWDKDGSERCQGMELFDLTTGAFVRNVHPHHRHSDLGVSTAGREFVATYSIAHPANPNLPGILLEWLDGGAQTYVRLVPWFATEHVSCRGPRGVCVYSSAGTPGDATLMGEVYAVDLATGDVRHLAHHRSTACSYWAQPKASLSKDGRRVTFTTDWGACGSTAPYVIELPSAL